MRIVAVRETTVPLSAQARSAQIDFGAMTASVLAVHTDVYRNGQPLVGLAFDSVGRYGHGGLLRERFIPRLLAASPDLYSDGATIDPARVWDILMKDEKFGGHGERCGSVGLIDAAVWDLAAKIADVPLWHLLATARDGPASRSVAVYASGGHYRPNNDIEALIDDIRTAGEAGHRRFKIKVGGVALRDDLHRVESVLSILEPGMTLALDGNGSFDREKATAYLEAFAGLPLAWLEEPVHPLDFELLGEIAAISDLPIATGENLFSCDDARNLLRYGGLRPDCDVLQFDVSLSYGIVEYRRILAEAATRGWRHERFAPHAGHLLAMHVVAGLGLGLAELAMDRTSVFGQITAGVQLHDGSAILPDAPGAGLQTIPNFDALFSPVLN